MYLSHQGNRHRLIQVNKDVFEFRNSSLASKHVNVEDADPFLCLASSLYAISDQNSCSENPKKTDRSLVYFTINTDEKYLSLLRVCLRSIIKNASDLSNIDFLIIGNSWDAYQALRSEFKEIEIYYHQVKAPRDGVAASMNKLHIFDFPFAINYQKILFLDCDIIFTQDIVRIFESKICDSKIYSTIHEGAYDSLLNTREHNITNYTKEVVRSLSHSGIVAFNTGQFLMLGSEKMKRHFENINLIRSLWQKEYFFEQSFLNTYFNYNFASDTKVLNDFFCIYYIGDHHIDSLTLDKSRNIHYAGSPCDGSTKLEWAKKEFNDLLSRT